MLAEAIFSGFVSKVVNDCVDVSRDKIKEAVRNRKNKHQNLESQIYNVIIAALNTFTDNRYEEQDILYDTAEGLLKDFQNERNDNVDVVENALRDLVNGVSNDTCEEFIKALCHELAKDDYVELYREIRLLQEEQENKKISRIEEKVDDIKRGVDEANQKLNAIDEKNNIAQVKKQKIKSRTQEYADKWNKNMFLNDFDKRDRNAGVNVKLSEVYLDEHLPHYIWGENDEEEPSTDLKELLSEYINKKRDTKMLLVFGQPGIGKSTLITWIAAKFADRINDILVYKFASDLGKTDWKNSRVSNRILEELGLDYSDLNGKILILDGFDEVGVENNSRRDILDSLYGDWIYNEKIKKFSLIVTCRENYVQRFAVLKCKFITLQPWDKAQIESFCNIFQDKVNNNISEGTLEKLFENKEILGVPLILYIVLALNISIKKEGSIVDVYDKIFSLEGGIYDRCIDNKKFADFHRIGEIKKQIHQISRDIAIWMFENNPEEASIPQEEYKKICNNIVKEQQKSREVQQDFLIGNFFKLKHCEGIEAKELYFVHRTIYEYFVVETIYSSIENAMKQLSDESQEELAGNIAFYLKEGEISPTIGEYLQHKLIKFYNNLDINRKQVFYQWWENTVSKMIENGMFYYTKKVLNYINIFAKQTQCFNNLIEILRLIFDTNRKHYILEDADQVLLTRYIKHSLVECKILYLSKLNLTKADLKRTNLERVDLKEADLRWSDLTGAYLERTDLRGANLREANLKEANLREANLRKANLRGAKLIEVKLTEAIIDERQIDYLEKKCNLHDTRVYIEETSEIISYEEYCRRIN